MRLAFALEYDGRTFCGFQSQPSGCGVQDALERALAAIAQREIRAVAAGRTDAGVHATSQIVHADVPDDRPLTAWVRGVNANLPPAVAVLWARPVADDFHARYAATGRHYAYLLLARPERPGLMSGGSVGIIGPSTSPRCARRPRSSSATMTSRRSARPSARRNRR